eukprot:TRINITY_DN10844_c0_g1_i1.p1 TRINITY_DN10844_c0_g1~~TRINITY_DN10844_c0_g1_i1.p1  ORF type:complete len:133 (+),score=23.46 TRINITY_DN10844_c0_g1_i1:74-472(+)
MPLLTWCFLGLLIIADDSRGRTDKCTRQLLTGEVIEANWGGPQYPNASTATDPIENYKMDCSKGCLYNVARDPHERDDVAADNQDKVAAMKQRMTDLAAGIWTQSPGQADPVCRDVSQSRYGGFLGPWKELD